MSAIHVGTGYFVCGWGKRSRKGVWYTEINEYQFDWCEDDKCRNSDEHEYTFDGQFFFKVKQNMRKRK